MSGSERVDHMVIPPHKVAQIVQAAGQAYLRDCVCRAHEQACPRDRWEVCLLFQDAPQDDLREARPITAQEALAVLSATDAWGAVYRLFYTHSGRRVTELCSCCACCCAPLRQLKAQGNYGQQLRSAYVAVTDPESCVGCGLCLESCMFEARWLADEALRLIDERCFGCGRCVDECPEGAIRLAYQPGRGVPIPLDDG